MKLVEASNPYVSPSAANHEDMTQPMGPLEQGDQALADAVQKVGERREGEWAEHNGALVRISKSELPGHQVVATTITHPDGSAEGASALVSTLANRDGSRAINTSVTDWPEGFGKGSQSVNASGNKVGGSLREVEDRQQAQEIKLKAAQRIEVANEQLEHAVEAGTINKY